MSAVMNPAETFRQMRTALKAANACTQTAARDPDAARRAIKHMRLALSAAAELERAGVLALLQARLATSDPGTPAPDAQLPEYRVLARAAVSELGDLAAISRSPIRLMHRIVLETAAAHGLAADTLRGPCRIPSIARARRMAMLLGAALTQASLGEIGVALGGRDTSTIQKGVRHAAADIAEGGEAVLRAARVLERLATGTTGGDTRRASDERRAT